MPQTLTISIHAPREGSDDAAYILHDRDDISIHAPREGSDFLPSLSDIIIANFNPRSPRGERRGKGDREAQDGEFQSTLPARGATRDIARQDTVQGISIHAPREGSDCWHLSPAERSKANFNPRSPRGERPTRLALARSMSPFQSTLPARGATVHDARQPPPGLYFNPRSPRGERLDIIAYQPAPLGISIHAPREGSDQLPCRMAQADRDFNPRSPRGERRHCEGKKMTAEDFNPRSPRGERLQSREAGIRRPYFNPRSPRGERQYAIYNQHLYK